MKRATVKKQLREKKKTRKQIAILRQIIDRNGRCDGIVCDGSITGITCPMYLTPFKSGDNSFNCSDDREYSVEDEDLFQCASLRKKRCESLLNEIIINEKLKFLEKL